MKKFILTVVTALTLTALAAAEEQWLTDFAQAQTQAKKENKLLLLDFTGSDWCPPCKALHRNVLSTSEFLQYAQKNLVLVEVDFPKRKPQSDELKKANRDLARQYEVEGYPTIIVLDSSGKQLSKEVGYRGDNAKSFIGKMKKLNK